MAAQNNQEQSGALRTANRGGNIQRRGDFEVIRNDTGDGLFSLEELAPFSGLQQIVGTNRAWTDLVGVPTIAGISAFTVYGRDVFWWVRSGQPLFRMAHARIYQNGFYVAV